VVLEHFYFEAEFRKTERFGMEKTYVYDRGIWVAEKQLH
jgi:hypothetical protein